MRGGWWMTVGIVGLLVSSVRAGYEVAGDAGRVDVGGWAEGYAVVATDADSRYQKPAAVLALTVEGDVRRKARFFLDVRSTFGGTPKHPDGIGVINLGDLWQNVSPGIEFEEGWVDATFGNVDLRVGKQKFAWGKLDTFQPTDVLNPRRYTDPFVRTEEENKIGIPAARASYFLPPLGARFQDVSATLVWIPVPVAPRFPLEEERWYPESSSVPAALPVRGATFGPGVPNVLSRNTVVTENDPPAHQLDEGGVALRLAGLWRGADWSLYYYDGPETWPSFDVLTTIRAVDDFATCPTGRPPAACEIRGTALLRQTSARIRLVGADAAQEWRGFTARVEGAWSSDRMLPSTIDVLLSDANLRRVVGPRLGDLAAGQPVRVDLGDLFVPRDIVEWGIGVDRSWRGWTPVLQLNQTFVLDNSTPLLLSDVDTRLLGVVRKSFLAERMPTELGVVQGLARGYTAGILRLGYDVTDHLRVRVGYVLIAGSRRSLVGQYHDNDEAFFQVRYSY